MDAANLDPQAWAQAQFARAQLGDQRRTERLVKLAAQVAAEPSSSFPQQTQTWADLKAAYRWFDCPDVTFEAIATPHWQQTRACAPGRYLLIDDTTEIDFPSKRHIRNLGPTGNGSGRGFLLHSALMVSADREDIYGLAGQTIHYRKPVPKRETRTQRLKRQRESIVWQKVIREVGQPPPGVAWVHVMDRGSDDFEVFHLCRQIAVDWLARAKSLHRNVRTPDGTETPLKSCLQRLPVAGTFPLALRTRPTAPARIAQLVVRYGPVILPPPRLQSPELKRQKPSPIPQYVVWVREINRPAGVEPIDWVLYTSLPVHSFADAMMMIRYYEKRWLIEEWHKALKTGCQVTRRQLKTGQRLEAMVSLMGIEALRLLQLKALARTEPERPAAQLVPQRYLEMLQRLRPKAMAALQTVRGFFRELAKLGGFLGRKHDGEPGWITVWRGWEKLHLLLRGAEVATGFRLDTG